MKRRDMRMSVHPAVVLAVKNKYKNGKDENGQTAPGNFAAEEDSFDEKDYFSDDNSNN